jgi:hypothetical protein
MKFETRSNARAFVLVCQKKMKLTKVVRHGLHAHHATAPAVWDGASRSTKISEGEMTDAVCISTSREPKTNAHFQKQFHYTYLQSFLSYTNKHARAMRTISNPNYIKHDNTMSGVRWIGGIRSDAPMPLFRPIGSGGCIAKLCSFFSYGNMLHGKVRCGEYHQDRIGGLAMEVQVF